jgi:hypothetical protein
MADQRDDVDDYIRRVTLAISGYERGEHISMWIINEHFEESIELVRKLGEEIKRLKQDAACRFSLEELEHAKNAAYLKGLEQSRGIAMESVVLALRMGAGEHARVAATIQDRIQSRINEAPAEKK